MARMTKAERIAHHMKNLQRIFPDMTKVSAVANYKRLHRLEAEARSAATRACNEPVPEGWLEKKQKSILKRLNAVLRFREAKVPVFVNTDPRGCALKIDDAYVREHGLDIERDWGGYGLICPSV